jgi:hypothetical protein
VPDDISEVVAERSTVDTTVSQSENLLLGLMGCLLPSEAEDERDTPTEPAELLGHTHEIGIKGPFKRIPIYDEDGQWRSATGVPHFYSPSSKELQDVDQDGFPELVSAAFEPKPILYYRAVPGRSGLQHENSDAELSVYDYRQNGLADHGYGEEVVPQQARLAAMVWDKSSAREVDTFTPGDSALRSDSFVLIAPGPDGLYANNTLKDDTEVAELAEQELDNITNIR